MSAPSVVPASDAPREPAIDAAEVPASAAPRDPGLQVRPLVPSDVHAVAALHAESFERAWSVGTVHDELSRSGRTYVGAFDDGDLVGVVGLADLAGQIHVMTVATRRSHRRRGIARTLLGRALTDLERGAGRGPVEVTLEVREGDVATRGLYSSLGFVAVGERPRYYRDEAAILMTRQVA